MQAYLDLAISVLNLSFSEIKGKYANYPHCLPNYFENGIEDKYIEIRFDVDEVTLSCNFNTEDQCDMVYLFTDSDERINDLILYLKENYEFDFILKRWTVLGYYVKISGHAKDDMCLAFFNQCL